MSFLLACPAVRTTRRLRVPLRRRDPDAAGAGRRSAGVGGLPLPADEHRRAWSARGGSIGPAAGAGSRRSATPATTASSGRHGRASSGDGPTRSRRRRRATLDRDAVDRSSPSTAGRRPGWTATRSPPRSRRTASTSSRGASSTTGRAGCCAQRPLPELPGRGRWQPNVRACMTPARGRHAGPTAERLALAAARTCWRSRTVRSAAAGRLLLQDVHPAARSSGRCTSGCSGTPQASARWTPGAPGRSTAPEAPPPCRRGRHRRWARRAAWRRSRPRRRARGSCSSTTAPSWAGTSGSDAAGRRRRADQRGERDRSRRADSRSSSPPSRASSTSPGATAIGIYEGGLVGVRQGRRCSCASARGQIVVATGAARAARGVR